ncbi:hypothetical protein MAAFP003_3450 [Mycobacterium ahvazicum]|uniref:Uncharacterized protein n=1 Tax=Mycobacterium ahvazicum TaxID=1964395 RepID=A0A2K4YDA1_9MYCO|nr:hypothetical protein MAAFP003_3450 [Mycobacterium ahvazicum]
MRLAIALPLANDIARSYRRRSALADCEYELRMMFCGL